MTGDVRRRPSVWWSDRLWLGYEDIAVPALEAIGEDLTLPPAQRANAHVQLGRWHLASGRPDEALRCAVRSREESGHRPAQPQQPTLEVDALTALARYDDAALALDRLLEAEPHAPDLVLRGANVVPPDQIAARVAALNRVLAAEGLAPLEHARSRELRALDALAAPSTRAHATPTLRVSVIVPVFNGAATLPTALRALRAQTWQNLEIVIVDDGSTDGTASVADAVAATDDRIVVVRSMSNAGAYAARNLGLAHASGDLVTVHDADDWSHPQKIAEQAVPLTEGRSRATLSMWARVDENLRVSWHPIPGRAVLRPNFSSLMVTREVIERLGVWDDVRVNADAEYLRRVIAVFGGDALAHCHPRAPLALGRRTDESLTAEHGVAIRSFFEAAGARRLYTAGYRWWHARQDFAASLPVHADAPRCPFPVPRLLRSGDDVAQRVDVVLAGDLRRRSVVAQLARHARSAARRGRTVRLLDLPAIAGDVTRPLDPRALAAAHAHGADPLAAGEQVVCGTLVVLGAGSLRALPVRLPRIVPDRVAVVTRRRTFHPADEARVRERFGRAPARVGPWTPSTRLV